MLVGRNKSMKASIEKDSGWGDTALISAANVPEYGRGNHDKKYL